MKEYINKVLTEINNTEDLKTTLTLYTLAGITIAGMFIATIDDRKRVNLAIDQRDNSAQIMEMCGEDLEACNIDFVTRCLEAVREVGCVESEILPLYTPKGDK